MEVTTANSFLYCRKLITATGNLIIHILSREVIYCALYMYTEHIESLHIESLIQLQDEWDG